MTLKFRPAAVNGVHHQPFSHGGTGYRRRGLETPRLCTPGLSVVKDWGVSTPPSRFRYNYETR